MSSRLSLKRIATSLAEAQVEPLHFSERELLDFCRGELEDFESERIRSHLIICRKCMEEYRSIQAFFYRPCRPSHKKLDREWQKFQQRLSRENRNKVIAFQRNTEIEWARQFENASPKSDAEPDKPIWQQIVEIGKEIPESDLADLPEDLSKNLDHYLYGSPKQEE